MKPKMNYFDFSLKIDKYENITFPKIQSIL